MYTMAFKLYKAYYIYDPNSWLYTYTCIYIYIQTYIYIYYTQIEFGVYYAFQTL